MDSGDPVEASHAIGLVDLPAVLQNHPDPRLPPLKLSSASSTPAYPQAFSTSSRV
jgi:hypothetical protein